MTNYREVKRKANVGERIKIVNAGYAGNFPVYKNGDVAFVTEDCGYWGVRIDRKWSDGSGINARVNDSEYVVLEPIAEPPTQPSVPTPQLPELFSQFLRNNSAAVRAYLDAVDPQIGGPITEPIVEPAETIPAAKPPKRLTRPDVIAQARADVAELLRIGRSDDDMLSGSKYFHGHWYDVDFVVNREKRTVVALVYEIDGLNRTFARYRSKPDARGIARCAPDDVLHADIGKAIALRRALGLTVPDAYTQAPKPEELHVGAVVNGSQAGYYSAGKRFTLVSVDTRYSNAFKYAEKPTDWIYRSQIGRVVDDTDVDYAKEAE